MVFTVFGRFRRRVPAAWQPPLEADERVVAWARTADDQVLVATNWGLWLPEDPPTEAGRSYRLGWHEIHKAAWSNRRLTVTAAHEVDRSHEYRVMADLAPVSFQLDDPDQLPAEVHDRVNRSVAYTSHHDLAAGGGVRVVARRVSGVDGLTWVVRYDQGTDMRGTGVATATADLVRQTMAMQIG